MSWKHGKIRLVAALLVLSILLGHSQVVAENIEPDGVNEAAGEQEAADEIVQADDEGWNVLKPLENLSLYATSAVLMDADSGRVLYEKNGYANMAMASTTKIMTCIVALENCDLDVEVTVSAYAASMPKVKLYVRQGETYRLRDLLYSLMLESHNDSALVIAEAIGREFLSEELKVKIPAQYTVEESKQALSAFAGLMNQKALDIGCRDTWFITPNGLDATQTFYMEDGSQVQKEHTTTAADLAAIMAYCIQRSPKKDLFLEITRTSSYGFSANGRSFSLVNHNSFLTMMDGALSGKTGFTNKAGYCYVGALQRDNRTFIVALLACGWPNHKTYKWSDTRVLMEYGLSHYEYHSYDEVTIDTGKFKPVMVYEGCTQRLGDTAYVEIGPLQDTDAKELTDSGLLLREDEQFELRYSLPDSLKAPVAAGTQVGEVLYLLGEKILQTIPIVTKSKVEKIDFRWCVRQIGERFLLKNL
ncbi:MAG: D-alanyl-D-alanine carboxypeptidase [Lachnospiraceae bacterium]|nr:D-alanyl-D-alanine carboxypeptidase [Lachnospiraceae bacterium]